MRVAEVCDGGGMKIYAPIIVGSFFNCFDSMYRDDNGTATPSPLPTHAYSSLNCHHNSVRL